MVSNLSNRTACRRALAALLCGPLLAAGALAQHAHGPGPREPGPGRWWDGAHGHAREYPAPGWRVTVLPPRAQVIWYGGSRYAFHEGVWYAPGPGGYVVVRPPYGVVVGVLPAFATVLTIGALTYWYADGVYYRTAPGGYEVVAPPVAGSSAAPAAPAADRLYVYPRQGQSAEKQAGDEYDCHKWAVGQSGFDPTAAATGTASDAGPKADYTRAQTACLEGRGYTVR